MLPHRQPLRRRGGALYATSAATVLVSRCTFKGNAATGAVGHGGAILTVGGVGIAAVSCEFSGNTADAGMDGAVHLLDTSGELTNCVFEANAAGGGVARTVSAVGVTTVTFDPALASASAAGTRVDNWGSAAADMVVDLRVDDGIPSPCIDTGNNASVAPDTTDLDGDSDTTEDVPYDLDGLNRVQGSFGDMGAYEQ